MSDIGDKTEENLVYIPENVEARRRTIKGLVGRKVSFVLDTPDGKSVRGVVDYDPKTLGVCFLDGRRVYLNRIYGVIFED